MTEQEQRRTGRRSLGGRVVEDSLLQVGFAFRPTVMMVETAPPRPRAAEVVLVQNAWNFLPEAEFRELARPYPARTPRSRFPLSSIPPRSAASLRQSIAKPVWPRRSIPNRAGLHHEIVG